MHATGPRSTPALTQARPTMSCIHLVLGMGHFVAAKFITKYSSYTTGHNCNSKRKERQVLIKVLADGVQLLCGIDISGCVCNEYRLLQVLLQQQARSTPFF